MNMLAQGSKHATWENGRPRDDLARLPSYHGRFGFQVRFEVLVPAAARRVYLAGPMSGLAEHNFPLFHRVAAELRERGHTVFNPAENDDGGQRRPRSFYMRLDVPALLDSDAVVLLPDWQKSRGANLEVWLAIDLGLPIYRMESDGDELTLRLVEDLDVPILPFRDGSAGGE